MSIGQAVYLIVVDAYSKWLECIYMDRSTSTNALILKLKELFSRFGVPNVLVSDNDVKINSAEFIRFCRMNGIEYLTSPIYHPASNGQAENSVKTCKKMIKCMLSEKQLCQKNIVDLLQGFLFNYRNTIHCATGSTPAMLMLGRNLRCRLDLVLPQRKKTIDNNNDAASLKRNRCFKVGDAVWAKWFIARKSIWSAAIVKKAVGSRMFEIYFKDYDCYCYRHIDQMRKLISKDGVNNSDAGKTVSVGSSLLLGPSVSPAPPLHNPPPPLSQSQARPSMSTPASSSPPAVLATDVGEEEVPAVTDGEEMIVSATDDNGVMPQRDEDNEEWEEACESANDDSEPAKVVVSPRVEPHSSSAKVPSIGRTQRARKPVNYKQYF